MENLHLFVLFIAACVLLVGGGIRLFSMLMSDWLINKTRPKGVKPEDDVVGAGRVLMATLLPAIMVAGIAALVITGGGPLWPEKRSSLTAPTLYPIKPGGG